MILSKIRILNFRCFETLELALDPRLNVCVGENAAGKTALLEAINIGLCPLMERLRPWRGARLSEADLRRQVNGRPALAADIFVATVSPALEWAVQQWRYHGGLSLQEAEDLHLHKTKVSKCGRNGIQDYADSLLERHDRGVEFELPVFAFYDAERGAKDAHGPKAVPDSYYLRFGAYAKAHRAGISFSEAVDWFNRTQHEALKNPDAPERKHLECVKQAVHTLLPQIHALDFEPTANRLSARFASPGGVLVELPVNRLSHGYQGMLALVMDFARRLAQANPHLANPLEAEAICMIDEVDLHLHPEWQQRVVPDLLKAFPKTQFIVTTHSPQVLTAVKGEHIRIISNGGRVLAVAPDVGTWGAESSRVLEEVFSVHSRPPNVESVRNLEEYLRLVELQTHDTARGRQLRQELEQALGRTDPDLLLADTRISQLQVLHAK